MARRPTVARKVPALRRALDRFGKASIALVPTMGALHAGHIALVQAARRRARRVVVSIFINPTQFAPGEDLDSYPRSFAKDLAALAAQKVDLVWAPDAATMYPQGFSTAIEPGGPAKAGLEDKFRAHFFSGVTTVVAKLFTQTRPHFALFGEKDYQQLCVVTQMARDLDLGVTIVPVKTVREKDGLALSSRNAYLAPSERKAAPVLYRTLTVCARQIKAGAPISDILSVGREEITSAGFTLDYLEARQTQSLAPVSSRKEPMRLLVAARIGRTRLIDNVAV